MADSQGFRPSSDVGRLSHRSCVVAGLHLFVEIVDTVSTSEDVACPVCTADSNAGLANYSDHQQQLQPLVCDGNLLSLQTS